MRLRCFGLAVMSLLVLQTSVLAQSNSGHKEATASSASESPSTFEPFDRWKAAVLAGDKSAIAAFYTTTPPSRSQTPQGKSEDPTEESDFWSSIMAKGVSNLQPKILEIEKPQPGMVVLVLRVEMLAGKDPGEPSIVAMGQTWIQQQDQWRIAATQRSSLTPVRPGRLPEPAKPNVDLYAPPEEAPAEIDAALQTASKEHKRVILVFGANWCFDCHVLNEAFHSKAIAPLVDANYVVVHVNIGEGNKNLDLAKKYDTPLDKGVPALAVLDPDGKVVYSQKQGEFESSARLSSEDVIQFLEKWKTPTTH